jgi:hypothetical protein
MHSSKAISLMKKGKIIYTGNFVEYIVFSLLLTVIGILTLGLGFIYLAYWSIKYFVTHLEIQIEE